MKNLKKVLAVVLALTMAMTMVSFAAFSDVTSDAGYAEAVSILSSLDILKGYEDGTFKPDATITRAEFAAVVCRLMGLGETAEGAKGNTDFSDVTADNWASGYVRLASQQGIVNGMGDGIFAPESPVTYEQAIKMVVAALGYTPMADVNGGYPGGFQVVAAQKGILDGIKGGKAGEAATRAMVAQMSYNSLEVPLMEQSGFGTDTTYETSDELLLDKLDIAKFTGAVDATSDSDEGVDKDEIDLRVDKQLVAIDGNSTASYVDPDSDYADLDVNSGDIITVNLSDKVAAEAKALLDYNVFMYIKDADTDDAELVAVVKKGTGNKEVTFASEDVYDSKTDDYIADDDSDCSKVYVYTDKDNDKYESYDLDIKKVYINNRAKANVDIGADIDAGDEINTEALAKEAFVYYANSGIEADIRLLNNESSGDEYQIAYITSYQDFVVDSVTARTYKILSKDSQKLVLDEENDDYRFDIMKDGKKVTFADIAENDVLSVAGYINEDNDELEYGTVVITSTPVTGKVTSYDSTDETVTIDGKDYDLNEKMVESYEANEFRLGDQVTMYANARGVLVGVDKEQSKGSLKYGFATLIAQSSGISDTYQIRLLNTESTWETLDFASKVTFNDASSSETLSSTTSADWGGATGFIGEIGATGSYNPNTGDVETYYVNKVVAYELNGSGDISKVYFIPTTDTDDLFMAKNTYSATDDTMSSEYNESTESFGNVFVDDSTVIFSTNADIKATEGIDEDDVSVAKRDALIDRQDYTEVVAFNLDDDMYAAVICGADLVGAIDWASNFTVVAGTSSTTNEDGDEGTNIKGICAGEEVAIFASDDADVYKVSYDGADATTSAFTAEDGITKGDVIIYSKDATGEADTIYVLVDASAGLGDLTDIELCSFTSGSDDYKFVYGYAYSITSSKLGLALDAADAADIADETSTAANFSIKSTTTFATYDKFYNSNKGRTLAGDIGDITFDKTKDGDGDFVFMRVSGDTIVEDVVVFKSEDN